jgi:hypothetical protein
MNKSKPKKVIGRREKIDLPDLELSGLEAKIDTGAYTSAIHCEGIELIEEEGRIKISFHIAPPRNQGVTARIFKTEAFTIKNIRSSFGQTERRYVIRTRVRIGKRLVRAEFSLSDRTEMRYPVLLGRKLLKHRFIVDVSLVYTLDK